MGKLLIPERKTMGRVWKFADNINTDQIIPAKYDITTDQKILAQHCLCELRPDFPSDVKHGDLIVAGENFGSGSSREQAPVAIKASGIKAVIAHSFARIFYRNSINIGLPVFISRGIVQEIKDGDDMEIDLEKFCLMDPKTRRTFTLQPLPPFILNILKAGGIIPLLKTRNLGDLY